MVAVALAATVPASAMAATRYVEAGGVDAGGCTNPAAPCGHVQFAADQAVSGDTVQIAPGIYLESVEVPGKVLTFDGAGAGTLSESTGATVIRGENGTTGPGARAFELPRGGALRFLRAEGGDGGTGSISVPPSGSIPVGESGGAGVRYASAAPGQTTLELDEVVAIGGNVGTGIPLGSGGDGLSAASAVGPVALSVTGGTFAGASSSGLGGSAGLELSGAGASAVVEGSQFGRGTTGGFETGIGVFAGADASVNLATIRSGTGAAVFAGRLSVGRSHVHGAVQGVLASPPGPGPEAEVEIVDSLVTVAQSGLGTGAAVIQAIAAGGGVASLTARGTTFVAQGGTAAVWARQEGTGSATASLRSSIARHVPAPDKSAADLLADGGAIEADFSSFTDRAQMNGGSAPVPGGASNIAGDPRFVDPAGGDYRLQGSSPLVDRGDPGIVAAGQLDLAGSPRSLDGNRDCVAVPDVGAFEVTGQSTACPAPPNPSSPVDLAPVISSFGMTNRAFAPAGGRRARGGKAQRGRSNSSAKRPGSPKRGTRFTFTLSEAARVTIAIERRTRGRKVGRRGKAGCVKQTRGNRDAQRCRRFVRATKPLAAPFAAGRQSMPFSGRAGRRALRPGLYRASIVATDGAGQSSQPRRITFRILPG